MAEEMKVPVALRWISGATGVVSQSVREIVSRVLASCVVCLLLSHDDLPVSELWLEFVAQTRQIVEPQKPVFLAHKWLDLPAEQSPAVGGPAVA